MTHVPPRELVSSQRPGERAPLVRVVGRCLSSLQLENDDGEEGNLLIKQPLQWASEKRRAYRVPVEAERVSGNAGFDGCLLRRSLHAREGGTSKNLVQQWQGLRSGLIRGREAG